MRFFSFSSKFLVNPDLLTGSGQKNPGSATLTIIYNSFYFTLPLYRFGITLFKALGSSIFQKISDI